MNLYLIEEGKKIAAGDYVQVGHRLVHRDDIVFSGVNADAGRGSEGPAARLPDPGKSRCEVFCRTSSGSFLHVEGHGQLDFQNGGEILAEIMRLHSASKCSDLLVDFCQAFMETNLVEQFYLVHDLVRFGYHRIGKLAVVTPAPKTGFFEQAARNRMIDLKFFTTLDDAVAWLAA